MLFRALYRLHVFASRPRFLIGASVFRIVAGAAILLQYLLNYASRRYLFGPDSLLPFDTFCGQSTSGFSLYRISNSLGWFEIVYHAGLVVAFAWMVGWRTRWTTPVNYILWWSLHRRFDLLWDGGDNLMQLIFVYAMFADVSAVLSLDARRQVVEVENRGPSTRWVLHNAAILAMTIQVALVYFNAGVAKLHGSMWGNGTAMYYVFRATEFALPPFSDWMAKQAVLLTFLCYATVGFQIAFPCLIFLNRRSRIFAVGIGLVFHLGILFGMGLTTFAMFMIAVDLTIIADDEYAFVGALIARFASKRTLELTAQP